MADRSYKYPQEVTRWRSTGERDIYNAPVYEVAKYRCRYEERLRLYTNEFGQMVRSNAYVWTMGDDLRKGDLVILGDHVASQEPVKGAFEVKQYSIIPSLRGNRIQHRYIL